MKFKNKIFLIFICLIYFFIFGNNKVFASSPSEIYFATENGSFSYNFSDIDLTNKSYIAVYRHSLVSNDDVLVLAYADNEPVHFLLNNNINFYYYSGFTRLYWATYNFTTHEYSSNSSSLSSSKSLSDVDLSGSSSDVLIVGCSNYNAIRYDDGFENVYSVFRRAGSGTGTGGNTGGSQSGTSGGGNTTSNTTSNELSNPYGNYITNSLSNSNTNTFGDDFEDNSDTSWFGSLINWLLTPFRFFAEKLIDIWDFFSNLIHNLLVGLFDFFKTILVPNKDDIVFNEVRETLYNKFPIISSFRTLLNSFQNSFDNEAVCPSFIITFPNFLGGGIVNVLDLRFYNQYRSYINGFIVAVSYYLFIRKMYYKIPKLVKGE